MPAYYFDTSALLKRYIDEAGSTWTRTTIARSGEYRYIVQITGVEVVSALTRLALGKYISTRVRDSALAEFKCDYAHGYVITAINLALIQKAMFLAARYALILLCQKDKSVRKQGYERDSEATTDIARAEC